MCVSDPNGLYVMTNETIDVLHGRFSPTEKIIPVVFETLSEKTMETQGLGFVFTANV